WDQNQWPCQKPPWGTLNAIDVNKGEIVWKVPLGSLAGLNSVTVAPNLGASVVTAGGLVFIGATTDSKFRAFDSRTGKEVWVMKIDATADTIPMTYQARNGKQYVVIAAGGTNRFRMIAHSADEAADSLIAFSLP